MGMGAIGGAAAIIGVTGLEGIVKCGDRKPLRIAEAMYSVIDAVVPLPGQDGVEVSLVPLSLTGSPGQPADR
jgi:hypothetical protein